jgi:hypothetical protein
VPSFTADGLPQLGSTRNLVVGNSKAGTTIGAIVLGGSAVSLPSGFGGTILADPSASSTFVLTAAQQSFPFTVARSPASCGATYYLQVVELDPGASHGVSFSRGLQLVFGR